jgi:hypothetical protein
MNFYDFWIDMQARLDAGMTVKNWTSRKGYLGDEFKIFSVSEDFVEVDSPNAQSVLRVRKSDFEVMYENWDAYCAGRLQRQELRNLTRFSKYTMSIIKYLESR